MKNFINNLCISAIIPITIVIAFIALIVGLIIILIKIGEHFDKKNGVDKQHTDTENQITTAESQESITQPQSPVPTQNTETPVSPKRNHGFLTFLGVVFLILLIIGGVIFIAKCTIKQANDGEFNSDGNPVSLNRAATVNDFTLTESISATISNLKESYKLVPNEDIKNLEITFKYYDSNNNIIATKIKNIGNVTKSSEYTISVEHSLSEFFSISKYSYYVSGGTVSYFR